MLKLHWVSICRFVFLKKRNEKGKKEEGKKKGRKGKDKKKLNGFVTECEKGNGPSFHGHFLSA